MFPLSEIELYGVLDANVPNKERIVFLPKMDMNLQGYATLLVYKNAEGSLFPLQDHFFWFGNVEVEAYSWIFLYTNSGRFERTRTAETSERAYVFHWGKENTIFSKPDIIPVTIRIDNILLQKELMNIYFPAGNASLSK